PNVVIAPPVREYFIWSLGPNPCKVCEPFAGRIFAKGELAPEQMPGRLHIGCVAPDTAVSVGGSIKKVFRRPYRGSLITLTAAGGIRLSATPNHPVLTRNGWVPIESVNVGDDILKPEHKVSNLWVDNPEDMEPAIEDVFGAACAVGVIDRVS